MSKQDLKKLIRAFISSRFHYCNSHFLRATRGRSTTPAWYCILLLSPSHVFYYAICKHSELPLCMLCLFFFSVSSLLCYGTVLSLFILAAHNQSLDLIAQTFFFRLLVCYGIVFICWDGTKPVCFPRKKNSSCSVRKHEHIALFKKNQ